MAQQPCSSYTCHVVKFSLGEATTKDPIFSTRRKIQDGGETQRLKEILEASQLPAMQDPHLDLDSNEFQKATKKNM